MTTIRERVYQEDDQYLARNNALKALETWSHTSSLNPAIAIEYQKLRAAILQAALDGDEINAQIAIPYQQALADWDRLKVVKEHAAKVAQEELHRLETDKSDRTDIYLDRLSDELDRVIQAARTQAEHLDGANTAEDAIETGNEAIEAWKALGALADEYREIRAIHLDLLSGRNLDARDRKYLNDSYFATAQFANSIDVHPAWHEKRKIAAANSSVRSEDGAEYVSWMARTRATLPGNPADWLTSVLPSDDAVGTFVWLVTEAELWLPTLDQLTEAQGTADKAISPVSKFDHEPSAAERKALVAHYAVTGATPTFEGLDAKVLDPGVKPKPFHEKYGRMSQADIERAEHRERGVPIGGY